jgi:hypothetical protein
VRVVTGPGRGPEQTRRIVSGTVFVLLRRHVASIPLIRPYLLMDLWPCLAQNWHTVIFVSL